VTRIELPDELTAALKAKAAAAGLTLEAWLMKLAEAESSGEAATRTGADLVAAMQASPHREMDLT
jgi:plasmid stability protein